MNASATLPRVDLRSDTVTRPTPGMREVMAQALVGDDVFGDDPSVNELQDKIAKLLGFEAALFMSTGTQSNLCGVLSHCQRGDEYIVGQMAHCYRWEGGGAAVFGSVQPQPLLQQADGSLALADIEAAIKPDDPHFARTKLLAIENTWGGKVVPQSYLNEFSAFALQKGLSRHLDGARLFNAAVAQAKALGTSPYDEAKRIAQCFDSVSVCCSKGLGAPMGGLRQAGFMAAAASYALDHHVTRLAEDHQLMQHLAQGLSGIDGLQVEAPQTNILFVDLVGDAKAKGAALQSHLKQAGIDMTGLYRLRFVTHLDVDRAGIDRTVAAVRQFFNA